MIFRGVRAFGSIRYLWDAVREISPREIRAELERPVLIALYGQDGSGRKTLARALFGTEKLGSAQPQDSTAKELFFSGVAPGAVGAAGRADLSFLVIDATRPDWSAERRAAQQIAERASPLLLVVTHADLLPVPGQAATAVASQFGDHPPELTFVLDPRDEPGTRARLGGPLLRTVPQIRLALGYRFPSLRRVVSEDLIRESSRLNAHFAVLSSLPAMIPLVGGLAGGMADLLVLTKNQVLLVFKLAGMYGRDIDDRIAVLREIAPVVGGGFLWRSFARGAVGLFPPFVSALPKAAIAYVGTYVVGAAARYYYERGRKPSLSDIRAIQAEALRLSRRARAWRFKSAEPRV